MRLASTRRALLAAVAAVLSLLPQRARAERSERAVALQGGLVLPFVGSQSPTAFALATWSAGAEARYGLTDNLDVRLSFLLTAFSGRSTQAFEMAGSAVAGTYAFRATLYHPELGVRYKVFPGYNLAPYAEAMVGYLWGVYTEGALQPRLGPAASVDDEARGTLTASLGVAVDYRLCNMLFVGAAVRYVRPLARAAAEPFVSAPLSVAFYW